MSNTKQVYFSKGNLQYQASTNIWRFAENQWNYMGNANALISSNYSGWIDLFGWGTGNNPTNDSTWNSNYSSFNDWGNNAIYNGGNVENQWRTLTRDEWVYVIDIQNSSSGIRYAKALVNSVKGVLLFPDNWSSSIYDINSINVSDADFTTNTLDTANMNYLEGFGAIFLPVAGLREGTMISFLDEVGFYWSATYDTSSTGIDNAHGVYIRYDRVNSTYSNTCCCGQSVRLVHDAN